MKNLKDLKKLLTEKYDYDFNSEFWTDENLVIIEEVFNATVEMLKARK